MSYVKKKIMFQVTKEEDTGKSCKGYNHLTRRTDTDIAIKQTLNHANQCCCFFPVSRTCVLITTKH